MDVISLCSISRYGSILSLGWCLRVIRCVALVIPTRVAYFFVKTRRATIKVVQ